MRRRGWDSLGKGPAYFKVLLRRSENDGAWRVLKVHFQRTSTLPYLWAGNLYLGSRKVPGISIYPLSASNMSVDAVLSIMQCGYPRAALVNFTIGGAIFEKFVKRVTTCISLFKFSLNFG